MAKKRLRVICYDHKDRAVPSEGVEGNKNAITIVFNRTLHPLEAMGLFHMVKTDVEATNGK